ncbi:toxin-antitoxin system YwqK family antitoxin [Rathayibacter soli]|uniref:toxin-antitoxin system YwqK family antitoxin n=1 Tax=Rathayibacter soli TaxID=3144168 RepID=UPI0027E50ECC|nr:hypothetical protein [Glaciibacter superstes]
MSPAKASSAGSAEESQEYLHYHRDGTLWARGQKVGDIAEGYWEWFRKDGSLMRSGTFTAGQQTGEWTTYDRDGAVVKVTAMKPKPKKAS